MVVPTSESPDDEQGGYLIPPTSHMSIKIRDMFPDQVLYTTTEASHLVGRSAKRLRIWRGQHKDAQPSVEAEVGQTTVPLYTPADVERLRNYAATIRTGRPRKDQ